VIVLIFSLHIILLLAYSVLSKNISNCLSFLLEYTGVGGRITFHSKKISTASYLEGFQCHSPPVLYNISKENISRAKRKHGVRQCIAFIVCNLL